MTLQHITLHDITIHAVTPVAHNQRGNEMRTGRPKSDNPKSIRFSIRLDAETESKLNAHCRHANQSKGEVIRQALENYLNGIDTEK